MIIELATAVTAIATAISAVYAIRIHREEMNRSAPAIRIHDVTKHGDCALVNLSIFPTDRHVVINRITTNAEGVAQAPYINDQGHVRYHPAHEHSPFVDVDFDVLPAHVSSKPLHLRLSIKLKSTQSSFRICFHRDRSRFSAKHKVTATINKEAG